MDDDGLIHIPQKDYIGKKTWWTWIITLLIVPSLIGIFTAGKLFNRLEAAEEAVKQVPTRIEIQVLKSEIADIKGDIKELSKKQDQQTDRIIDIIKEQS